MSYSADRSERIADKDRDAAAELLRVALGEGRVSQAEFETRFDQVFTAQTAADLDSITGDLEAARQARDLAIAQGPRSGTLRLEMISGEIDRRGVWAIPPRIDMALESATSTLDLKSSPLPQEGVHIHITAEACEIRLVVASAMYVDLTQVGGHRAKIMDRKGKSLPRPAHPAIRVTGDIPNCRLKIIR